MWWGNKLLFFNVNCKNGSCEFMVGVNVVGLNVSDGGNMESCCMYEFVFSWFKLLKMGDVFSDEVL